jgi:hypothetical protein
MALGGARPGAGRPRSRDLYGNEVRAAEEKIKDRLPEIVDAQIELALGVKVEAIDATTGEVSVYRKPPDHKAGEALMNRIMGKVTDQVDVTSNGESITFNSESERLAALSAFIDSIRNGGIGQAATGTCPEDADL